MTIKIGIVGCGYWGPNLIRNFVSCPETDLVWASDLDENRLDKVLSPYPSVKKTTDFHKILADETVEAIAIATPVNTHFSITKACLESGKHVLVEKPLAESVSQGEELVSLAQQQKKQLMCDHTFCYTGAVRKIKEIVDAGILGKLLYYDSIRINLGLFQNDINVAWDLAPHDLSILDYLIPDRTDRVNAFGVCHGGNDIESMAYLSLWYPESFIAHFHVNWLSPVKIRQTIICGDKKMLVWDDMEAAEKIKIYDKGISVKPEDHRNSREQLLVSYRSGDMYAPRIETTEALLLVVKEFADCIREERPALTDGQSGLQVLRILEASQESIKNNGNLVKINYS